MNNRIIALDEMGDFESRGSGIRLVGGFSYDAEDVEDERKEAEYCLKKYCSNFNAKELRDENFEAYYPGSLHNSATGIFRTREGAKAVVNTVLEKKFKKGLEIEVIKFIQKKKGYLYAFLDPYVIAEDLDRSIGESNVINMKKGANLYERMAMLTIYNQLFYSLDGECPEYNLELATRT